MTDQQILIDALEKAGVIVAEHIEPGGIQSRPSTA
jgi:hypothetical protein